MFHNCMIFCLYCLEQLLKVITHLQVLFYDFIKWYQWLCLYDLLLEHLFYEHDIQLSAQYIIIK